MLQLLLDQGLIGLVVEGTAIVLAFKALMRRAARRPDDIAGHGLLRLFGLLLAASAAEAVVSASFAQLPFWLLVVVLAMALTDDAPPERLVEIDAPADVRVA
jgi:O-antigen ligase